MKARQLAYEILYDVIVHEQYANLALKQRLKLVDLPFRLPERHYHPFLTPLLNTKVRSIK